VDPVVVVLCSRGSGRTVLQLLRDSACGPVADSGLRSMVILNPNLSHGSINPYSCDWTAVDGDRAVNHCQ